MKPKKVQEMIRSIENFDILDKNTFGNRCAERFEDSFSWSKLLFLMDDENNQKLKMNYLESLSLTSTQKILNSIYDNFDSLNTLDNSVFDSAKYQNISNPQEALILTYSYMLLLKNHETYVWFKNLNHTSRKDKFRSFTRNNVSESVIIKFLENLESKFTVPNKLNRKCVTNKEKFSICFTYRIDEYGLELKFKMPHDYPLEKFEITIESDLEFIDNRPCSYKCKKLMKYNNLKCLENQISDIVETFEKYISKVFNEFEDCSICCSILNGKKHLLPLKSCPVCNKKFHSVCLVSWFKGSIGRSCPLCRSNFDFLNKNKH